MCDTRLKGSSNYGPFEQMKSGKEVNGGEVHMAEQKKGIFGRLFGQQQKSGGCCSVRIEEISEEDEEKTPQQIQPVGRRSSCCGPAPKVRSEGDSGS